MMALLLCRDFLAALIAFNAVGTIWGFFWYADQLSRTDWYFWLLTPDFPLTTFCFMLFLWWVREGKPWKAGWKTAVAWIAVLAAFKYGFWTVLVLGQYIASPGSQPDLQDLMMVASQLGLLAEGYLYRNQLPRLPAMYGIAMLWLLLNDYADWMLGAHTRLPLSTEFAFAMWLSMGLTVAAYFWGRSLLGGLQPQLRTVIDKKKKK